MWQQRGFINQTMTPFRIDAGVLTAPLHVLQMTSDGRIPVPNSTRELLVEVGTNAFDTWDQEVLPKQPHAFLVAFEPLVDKWSLLLARNSRARVAGALGWHHPRGIILPFAVSDRSGVVPFHVSPRDGCSSLRRVRRPERGGWRNNGFVRNACAKTTSIRHVPAVSLRTVLEEWLWGWQVSRLKIDAQGSDLSVLSGAGARVLRRVNEVSLEVLNDECDGIYEGQPNCSTVVGDMEALGFRPTSSFRCLQKLHFTQGSGCEANVNFRNVAASGPRGNKKKRRGSGIVSFAE